jgi:hypothetical protein
MAENLGNMLADMKLSTSNKIIMPNSNCIISSNKNINLTEAEEEVLSKSK